jgi:myo-inositol-1(or 4)-monophosphatase
MHPMLNIATRAARKAGNRIMSGFDRLDKVKVSLKAQNDYVTEIDHDAERIIIETLKQSYPTHGFLGEETGLTEGDDYQWIIDPLDGTTNFVHGYPHFCVAIALAFKDNIEHGLIFDPVRNDLFTASKGSGAFLNERRIRIKDKSKANKALLALSYRKRGLPDNIAQNLENLDKVVGSVRRAGSSALDLAYVAAGRLDACYQWGMNNWDVSAGGLMVKEAGGIVAEPEGKDFNKTGHLLAGNIKLVPQLEKVLV